MIQVTVDMGRCQHYGQCVFEAPHIFRLDDHDKLQHSDVAPDEDLPALEAAADICPMQAISLLKT